MRQDRTIIKPYPGFLQSMWLIVLSTFLSIISIFIVDIFGKLGGLDTILTYSIPMFLTIAYAFKRTCVTLDEAFPLRFFKLLSLIPIAVTVIGLGIIISEIDTITRFILPMPTYVKEMLLESICPKTGIWASYITILIIGPLAEEALCRGIVLRAFLRRYSVAKAVFASALFFGILHVNIWQSATAILTGIFFAWLFVKTRSLWPCIIGHFFFNLMAILIINISNFSVHGSAIEPTKNALFQPLWFYITGIFLIGFGIWWLIKIFKNK